MEKLIQFSTCGMKNIEKTITIDFSNQTINRGIGKITNVKGIFGYNGSGKTALITSVDVYKKILNDPSYLFQNETQSFFKSLINRKLKSFSFSSVFPFGKRGAIKHSIVLEQEPISNNFVISEENLAISSGRTLNEKFATVVQKKSGKKIWLKPDFQSDIFDIIESYDSRYSSFIVVFIHALVDSYKPKSGRKKFSNAENLIANIFLNVGNIEVYLSNNDRHSQTFIGKEKILEILSKVEGVKERITDDLLQFYSSEEAVAKENIDAYKKANRGLEKFVKVFKPDLKEIKLIILEDRDSYRVRRLFVYRDYNIEQEFESSGIKQLVLLYTFLKKCSDGGIVFIDEMDVNLNTVYFEKLISYFRHYGKGQLIFTTHNVESMNSLKGLRRSIDVVGYDSNVDTWVARGNKSAIKEYTEGYFEHSPMNIEDFDFVNIFQGE